VDHDEGLCLSSVSGSYLITMPIYYMSVLTPDCASTWLKKLHFC